ncbi:hypothetical protein HETIRDRAFT_383547 [Heterobasidion irregulare TC 32-1]|uniref:L domain-like protein n=1 Tax=Heterobasidion irregulare (strain TC 32-1) TaxID=747525 RepID=W4KCL2_HETIT|nr:uncharacterized protein HETIRDRAFT_383547 [Heterobasidion irregulare TC 32-1]ETW83479.1 hypothetical protein HETIRDRAFT_383547 [Heterobasidion irregulare TC 32-1]
MSRLPQPSSPKPQSRTQRSPSISHLAPPSPATSRLRSPSPTTFPTSRLSPTTTSSTTASPARLRTKSTPKPVTRKPAVVEAPPLPKATPLSIREAIALKRSEAKKAMTASGGASPIVRAAAGLDDALFAQEDPNLDMGRRSVRETIERARSTGPAKLALVPDEPPLPENPKRRGESESGAPSWFEQQDLSVLKAWNNEIVELQPEISLFGSLQNVDLRNNRLTTLPDTFPDLTSLTVLDLSRNKITHFPTNFFALPALISLNISHNALVSLPFNTPFSHGVAPPSRLRSTDLFATAIVRADQPLPRLTTLDASHNKIAASSIDIDHLPQALATLDLSENPLASGSGSAVAALLSALSTLPKLETLRLKKADLDDRAFPSSLFPSADVFEKLTLLDMEETHVTKVAVAKAFSVLSSRECDFDGIVATAADEDDVGPPPRSVSASIIKIIVGKKVVREAWEIEADRRAKLRSRRSAGNLRSAASEDAQLSSLATPPPPPLPTTTPSTLRAAPARKLVEPKREVAKEQWEIEAEQGLLTEGGRRRARALAAAAAQQQPASSQEGSPASDSGNPGGLLLKSKYYDARTQTLALPALAPPSRRAGHKHGFSLASNAFSGSAESADVAIPSATLPLSFIVAQPFADTLRVLALKGRRADSSFVLPSEGGARGPFLARLEELCLEGCGLGDEVAVAAAGASVGGEEKRREDVLGLVARLFPSLRMLDLSYNDLVGDTLRAETLARLLSSAPGEGRAGLRQLRLRGNRIARLDGFVEVARTLFGAGKSGEGAGGRWVLEELDVRDNAVEGLAGELGLLPLEVFLVEGNAFRVPPRRIWEREGTKGLLAWLRARVVG